MNPLPQTTRVCSKCGKPLGTTLAPVCDACQNKLLGGKKKRSLLHDIWFFVPLCFFGAWLGDTWWAERPLGMLVGVCLVVLIYVIRYVLSL